MIRGANRGGPTETQPQERDLFITTLRPCQDVCHVLRDHNKHDEFIGPRYLVYTAALEMHPLDTEDRIPELKQAHGIGYCNITKCCTKVCPEHITITDNAIIPLKERVVDEFFDPLGWLWKILRPKG